MDQRWKNKTWKGLSAEIVTFLQINLLCFFSLYYGMSSPFLVSRVGQEPWCSLLSVLQSSVHSGSLCVKISYLLRSHLGLSSAPQKVSGCSQEERQCPLKSFKIKACEWPDRFGVLLVLSWSGEAETLNLKHNRYLLNFKFPFIQNNRLGLIINNLIGLMSQKGHLCIFVNKCDMDVSDRMQHTSPTEGQLIFSFSDWHFEIGA